MIVAFSGYLHFYFVSGCENVEADIGLFALVCDSVNTTVVRLGFFFFFFFGGGGGFVVVFFVCVCVFFL